MAEMVKAEDHDDFADDGEDVVEGQLNEPGQDGGAEKSNEQPGEPKPEPHDPHDDPKNWFVAARDGNLERVLELLPDVDVNQRSVHGWTALMLASWKGHREIVRKLLDAKADVNIENNHEFTALNQAAYHGHSEIVEDLLAVEGARVLADLRAHRPGGPACAATARLVVERALLPAVKAPVADWRQVVRLESLPQAAPGRRGGRAPRARPLRGLDLRVREPPPQLFARAQGDRQV